MCNIIGFASFHNNTFKSFATVFFVEDVAEA